MRLDCPAWPPGAPRPAGAGRRPPRRPATPGAGPAGRAVPRGRETRRPAADDHEVVVVLRGAHRDVEALGELEERWALEHRSVLEQRDRQAAGVDAGDAQQLARLAVALDVEPAARHAVAREEVAQLVRLL